ncbi:MAG: hypothetical protein A2431_04300 [Candidatus Zambryskibacteria bacterium RIFOXYC1_FULL_39_10]|uniref:Uncharacterized protein n=1 Tax=Candidatus Zambryskibacteria bacterium RIFOXYC1_FULL_39_10 TaxID=1802779 RepID=A0A1G2V4H2_9BACT|nr:MAG: hypothetical protein A2431_04300 [Candidatus Zambryskibacteria bacterium RIFOXYC1_FULL_39_10]OHB16683.1 MAG: hypothetical protein A2605_00805 [Candidatus Zambryskibacteria bacterium RIFOXYD1_FULL_39_35]
MKIFVKAKAKAKENKIIPPPQKLWPEKEPGGSKEKEWFIISVKEPPVSGKANTAIIKLLAEYFKISSSNITLSSGASSKNKVFEIMV